MNTEELSRILSEHKQWVYGNGKRADLSGADLSRANLSRADLSRACLSQANLSEAYLLQANLSEANLSGAIGIGSAKEYLSQFDRDDKGIYVYKAIGDTYYRAPNKWNIEAGSYLEETVNPNRTDDCGCGVNFATRGWIGREHIIGENTTMWKCLIHWEDLADVVVPYNTDGKARCARLQLIEEVK